MKYELMVILDPKQTDKELEKTLSEIKSHISENGYTIVEEDDWGKRDFAYKIKGSMSGHYIVMNIEGEPDGAMELHSELRIQPGLFRYMFIKVPQDYKLTRYSTEQKPKTTRLKSKHAEELSRKVVSKQVSSSRSASKKSTDLDTQDVEDIEDLVDETVDTVSEEETNEKNNKLDEQLKAIIDDTDIDL